MKTDYSETNIRKIINESKSIKECLIKLGRPTSGDNYNFLKRKIKKYNISTSHFLSTQELRNLAMKDRKKPFAQKYELEEIFTKNSTYGGTGNNLKFKLFKNNLKENKCEECGQDEMWNGKKMSLHLDHINGDNKDNRLENLRILCPNCHACTSTYGGKNKDKYKAKLEKQTKKQQRKQDKIDTIKAQIMEIGIDFSIKSWGVKVAQVLGTTPQYALKWVKTNMPEVLKKT